MASSLAPLFGFFNLGAQEMIIILVIGVLLFGRKLPEVGSYLGRAMVEFKKGAQGLEDGFNDPGPTSQVASQPRPPQRITAQAPKFEEITTPNNGTVPPKA